MNRVNIKILILLMGLLVFSLSACGRIRDLVPGMKSSDQPTQGDDDVVTGEGVSSLFAELQAAGIEVRVAGQIDQPFFPVTGQVIEVNGSSVQIFEFADPSARLKVSATISASGDEIGKFMPGWIDQPNFWVDENLIVLYLGEDQVLIDLLSSVLGTPITEPGYVGDLTPEAVLMGQRALAQELNKAIETLLLIEYEHIDWTDGCLGLGRPDEGCLAVITPGWRADFEVNGQHYEVRIDESGDIVRWQLLNGHMDTGKAFIYFVVLDSSEGEVIGCGDALIPVEVILQDTVQPIKDALSQLLFQTEQYYGESGLYNALYQSKLSVDSVVLDTSGTATVNLSGEIILGGVCDVSRVQAQLERTVTQFQSVSDVKFFLNGEPLDEILSGAGQSELNVDYEGISFVYPSSLAEEVRGASVSTSEARPGIPFLTQIPEHIRFEFIDYVDSKTSLQAQIRIVSVERLRATQSRAGNLIALLRTVMAIKPALLIKYVNLLPFVDVSDMMFAQVQAVDFQNGKGVRFLTQYKPGKQPINNEQLFYTYHGLTEDGEYYVAAILPVTHPELPDAVQDLTGQERATIAEDYPNYLKDIIQILDAASTDTFTPDLSLLDEMIASIRISGLE